MQDQGSGPLQDQQPEPPAERRDQCAGLSDNMKQHWLIAEPPIPHTNPFVLAGPFTLGSSLGVLKEVPARRRPALEQIRGTCHCLLCS